MWRVARSLDTLLAQVNQAHPNRSKVSDGAIGDTAHAASVSDHNPDAAGVVRARDITNDPAHGFDAGDLAEQLRRSRDPRIKYVISNGRIFSATVSPWTWRPYSGADPHTSHVHVSVVPDSRADDTTPWKLDTTPQEEDDMFTDEDRKLLRNALDKADGNYIVKQFRWQNTTVAAQFAGLTAAVDALAKAQGVDAADVAAVVDKAVRDRLAQIGIVDTAGRD